MEGFTDVDVRTLDGPRVSVQFGSSMSPGISLSCDWDPSAGFVNLTPAEARQLALVLLAAAKYEAPRNE